MGIAVYVPARAVSNGSVWICDSDSLRQKNAPSKPPITRENLIRVDSGIRPGEWVVSNPSGLKSGQRLEPLFPD